MAFTFFVGQRVIPFILAKVEATGSRELFTLAVLALALGIAVGAAEVFGASMPLGAFLAGMVVGQSDFGARAADEALPMRDAFAVLFFVSVGMLLDPGHIFADAGLTAAVVAIIVVGKPLAAVAVARALGQPLAVGLRKPRKNGATHMVMTPATLRALIASVVPPLLAALLKHEIGRVTVMEWDRGACAYRACALAA